MNGSGDAPSSGPLTRTVEITNKRGLHARASAKFVQAAERFNAQVTVSRGSESVGGTSIMGLMMLGAGPGTKVLISATGPQAREALEHVCALVCGRFGEDE